MARSKTKRLRYYILQLAEGVRIAKEHVEDFLDKYKDPESESDGELGSLDLERPKKPAPLSRFCMTILLIFGVYVYFMSAYIIILATYIHQESKSKTPIPVNHTTKPQH